MGYQNIIHIDDDEEDQEIFNTALERISKALQLRSFSSAKDALTRLINRELVPDVIFLDLNMPVMGGNDFLREIKKVGHLSSVPVIIFSTSSNASSIATAKQLGAVDFITKPNRFDELVEILRPIIKKSQ